MDTLADGTGQTEFDSGKIAIVPVPSYEGPSREHYSPRRKRFSVPATNEPITLPRARLAVLGTLLAYEERRVPQDYLRHLVPELDEKQFRHLLRQLGKSSSISVENGYAAYLGGNGRKPADTLPIQGRMTIEHTEQALPMVLGLAMAYGDVNIHHDVLRSWTTGLTNIQFGTLLSQLRRVPGVRVESNYVTYRNDDEKLPEVALTMQLKPEESGIYDAVRAGNTDVVLLEELFPDWRVSATLRTLRQKGAVERVGKYGIRAVPPSEANSLYFFGLTVRELEILGMASAGYSNDEIAERLIISPRTVERHVGTIVKKFGLSSEFDSIAKAGIMYRERFPHEAVFPEIPIHMAPRGIDVYALVAKGYNNLKIAEELGIAPRTVERYMNYIFEKLNIPANYSKREYAALLYDKVKARLSTIEEFPFHLSKRERDVIELVCKGRSNAEIAKKLFIQPRTVGHHVSSIIGKNEASSNGLHPRVKISLDWMREMGYHSERSPFVDTLTRRENEILGMIALAFSNEMIATTLGIRPRTVEHHISSIFDKLDVYDEFGRPFGGGNRRVRAALAAGL